MLNKLVQVEVSPHQTPLAFEHQGRQVVKQILDHWKETGQWWVDEQEKSFFRVATEDAGLYELCHSHGEACWVLTRVFD